jgi:hypothetical protein
MNVREEVRTRYLQRIDVFDPVTEKAISSYYNCCLNETLSRLYNQYFVDRVPIKVVGSDGYVEYIGV